MAEKRNAGAAGELAAYLVHARKFGVECVYESAGSLSPQERRLLRIELDAIERAPSPPRHRRARRRRRSLAETTEMVRELRADGLVVGAIADKLGITDSTVRRCLNSKNGAANPHGYAAKSALKPNLA